ncbi:MAG: hypothetical protein RJA22_1125 [Verrucomicrobiota bacterium]
MAGLLAVVSIPWLLVLLALPLLLLAARYLPEFLAARARPDRGAAARVLRDYWGAVVLCLAQGYGVGRSPVAPGTVGSLLGVGWFLLLVGTGELWLFLAGLALGVAASVPVCGAAERLLGRTDPPSVVLDEVVVVPLCFLPWVLSAWRQLEAMPPVAHFFTAGAWLPTLVLFGLFRILDATKPWPISRVQDLPGGWGVTADDVLAAAVVAALSLLFVS